MGASFWDPARKEVIDARSRRSGKSEAQIYAMSVGEAAAMQMVCPQVW